MAEIREIEIDREFLVKLKGKVSTYQTDKELAEIFDILHEAIKDVICDNIVDDGVVSVEPINHGNWIYGEVVRCRDCKHYLGRAECEIEGVFCGGTNFYCAYGERKGENG